jgi:peroxiredoxin
MLSIGDSAPAFDLPGIDGKGHSLAGYVDKPVVCVAFTCNHCPYAKAYEDRLVALQAKYAAQGFQLVAINSNDASQYPEDSFEEMKKRAAEKKFNFPYLWDESQKAATAYAAMRTPHIFLLDKARKLAYLGRVDDNWQNSSAVKHHELQDAIEDLLAGREVRVAETFAIGCTIKWKHQPEK